MTEDEARRRRSAAIAGHTGDADTARSLLGDPSPAVRATALGALSRLAALRVDEHAAALDDPAATVRRRAVALAANVPGDHPPSILAALGDDDSVVAETAAWACGERSPAEPGAAAALTSLATTHNEHLVREAAIAALGAIGDPIGLPAVLAALDERATLRRRAVVALAAFDGPEVDD
ncbi:MAG: HEAT repeat domain-containing protein, partial [Acidimicrobiales bacterium]|nr:HEAT repeat domain-containing protein [Acidimicrobiales bacterium]